VAGAGWQVVVIVALRRLSQMAPGSSVPAGPSVSDASRDLWEGGIWLGGGLLVTLVSFGATSGGGGRYAIMLGPIVYGIVRIARGLSRRGGG
jgi:hypothetical protein